MGGMSLPPDVLARTAVDSITSGMVVGLGTGRAATRCIRALAARVKSEDLVITCVATSRASEGLARELGLTVLGLEEVPRVDYLFDGADEVDAQYQMIKGAGGALTRERWVAAVCAASGGQLVYVVDETKVTARLGTRARLPVEVARPMVPFIARQLGERGLAATRRVTDGRDVMTDNGHLLLDVNLPEGSHPGTLAAWLNEQAGVIDHGLFLSECQRLLVEDASGKVRERRR